MYQLYQLVAELGSKTARLNASSINFLCWNIKKGMRPNWREDLLDLADSKDLVIIQVAVLHTDLTEVFDEHRLTAWGSYLRKPWISTSACISG